MFAREFFARMYIETLVHGNMDSEVRLEFAKDQSAVLIAMRYYRPQKPYKTWSNAFSPPNH